MVERTGDVYEGPVHKIGDQWFAGKTHVRGCLRVCPAPIEKRAPRSATHEGETWLEVYREELEKGVR